MALRVGSAGPREGEKWGGGLTGQDSDSAPEGQGPLHRYPRLVASHSPSMASSAHSCSHSHLVGCWSHRLCSHFIGEAQYLRCQLPIAIPGPRLVEGATGAHLLSCAAVRDELENVGPGAGLEVESHYWDNDIPAIAMENGYQDV